MARKLTMPQFAALRAAAGGSDPWPAARRAYYGAGSGGGASSRSATATVNALIERGLLAKEPGAGAQITDAGREALDLFEHRGRKR